MLVTAFPSPATAAPFESSIPRATFLACHFASNSPLPLPVQHFCSATQTRWPGPRELQCFWPVAVSTTCSKPRPPTSTPLGDFCLPPDQNVLLDLLSFGPPSESARFPFAPRRRF